MLRRSPPKQLAIEGALLAPRSAGEPMTLTIDPSPSSTGWARGRHKVEASGTLHWGAETGAARVKDYGTSFAAQPWLGPIARGYSRFIQNQITRYGVDRMVIEQPATPDREHYHQWASGTVIFLFQYAIALAELNGIPWRQVGVGEHKRWALGEGKGRADSRLLMPWCRDVGYVARSADQAVAIVLLEYARSELAGS